MGVNFRIKDCWRIRIPCARGRKLEPTTVQVSGPVQD